MRNGEIKREARAALKGRWGLAVLLTLVAGVIYIGVVTAYNSLMGYILPPTLLSELSIAIDFVLAPLIMGYTWIFLDLVRHKPVTFGNLFDGYASGSIFGKAVGLSALIMLYTFLWSLLLIIPGIIKGLAYSQSYYIFRDHPEYGFNEIITESRKMMDGYKWKYFLLQLSFIGWALLAAILTLGIGFLWVYPYMTASMARFYDSLPKNPSTNEQSQIS